MRARFILIFCCVLAMSSEWAAVAGAAGQRQTGTVVEAAASKTTRSGEKLVRVDVSISKVADLGAFAFVMQFDTAKVQLADHPFETGSFLGSSGRNVFCDEPTIDSGAIRYACVTLGSEPAQGPDGQGTLASVYFKQQGNGTASFQLSRVELKTPQGLNIPATLTSASIEVEGSGGRGWLMIVAIAVGAVLLVAAVGWLGYRRWRRGRASGPSADAALSPDGPQP